MFFTILNALWRSLFSLLIVLPVVYPYPTARAESSASTHSPQAMLAERQISLADRYPNPSVNQVFKDNILLTLHYLSGTVNSKEKIDWNQIENQPLHYQFTLKPRQVFAFHDDVLPQYQGSISKTTNATFNYQQQFRTDGYLYGDGVCHLASLMDWVAQEAGLGVDAPTNHDFAVIPEIDKKYGVAIFYSPGVTQSNEKNNLYIKNIDKFPVDFVFDYSGNQLKFSLLKVMN